MHESASSTDPAITRRRALLVLGMHRSGTSALAGQLVKLGLRGPQTLLPINSDNPLGHWESEPFVEFNDRLLECAGTSWRGWSPVELNRPECGSRSAFSDEFRRLLDSEFGTAPFFVVKDPRLCRLLPFWLHALEAACVTPSAIVILRRPAEVATSLSARDGFTFEQSLLLWLRYMLDAEYFTRTMPRTFVSYEKLVTEPYQTINQIQTELGITWPAAADDSTPKDLFVTPGLYHHRAGNELETGGQLAEWVGRTFEGLTALMAGSEPGHLEAQKSLDDIRRAVDEAGRQLIGPEENELRRDRRRLEVDVRNLRHETESLRRTMDELRSEFARKAESLQATVDSSERELAAARTQIGTNAATIARLERENGEIAANLAGARNHVDALLASASWRVTAPLRTAYRVLIGRRPRPEAK